MKKKVVYLLLVLSISLFLTACAPPPSTDNGSDSNSGGGGEVTPPFVYLPSLSPTANATNVAGATNVSFSLKDHSSGVAQNQINVSFAAVPVIVNGVFQTGYTGTITANLDNGFDVIINPNSNFNDGETIIVYIDAQDQATPPNVMVQVSYSFTIIIGSWSSADSMAAARSLHLATLLQDGRVLVTGGDNMVDGGGGYFYSAPLTSCELYSY